MTVSLTPGGAIQGISFAASTEGTAYNQLNLSSLHLPLTDTVVPARGSSTPTFTRATAAWSFDNEGKLNLNIPAGCPRFTGARFVRNRVVGSSEDFTNASWTKSRATVVGNKLLDSVDAGTHRIHQSSGIPTGTWVLYAELKASELTQAALGVTNNTETGFGRFIFDLVNGTVGSNLGAYSGSASMTPLDNGYFGCQIIVTVPSTEASSALHINTAKSDLVNYTGTGTDGVLIRKAQAELVSGQADQTASEYVSVGVLSSPYYGAGVDGCKWFPTNKDGSAISSSTLEGYFAEPQRTNNCLWNRDLTNVAWTNTNITAAKTATGLDNVANSATRLTAAATDATITQLLTAATGTRTLSAYIKRVSGSGTISLTRNGGTNWTDITSSLVTGSWVLVQMTSDVGANPTVGIKMGTSGDVIDVDCVQDENGAWATSPILTTTAAVTRNGDVLSYTSAFDVAQGSALCTVQSDVPVGTSIYMLGSEALGRLMYLATATSRTQGTIYDGTTAESAAGLDLNTGMRKRCSRWGTDLAVCCDGGSLSPSAFDGSIGASGTLFVGCSEGGGTQISGPIREVHIWPTPLTDVQMKQVTS